MNNKPTEVDRLREQAMESLDVGLMITTASRAMESAIASLDDSLAALQTDPDEVGARIARTLLLRDTFRNVARDVTTRYQMMKDNETA